LKAVFGYSVGTERIKKKVLEQMADRIDLPDLQNELYE